MDLGAERARDRDDLDLAVGQHGPPLGFDAAPILAPKAAPAQGAIASAVRALGSEAVGAGDADGGASTMPSTLSVRVC